MEAVIFGAGKWAEGLKRGLEKYYPIRICAICDNDEEKWGNVIENTKVISPQELVEGMFFEKIFICVSGKSRIMEIEMQLLNMGIEKEKIVNMLISKKYQEAFIERDFIRRNWIKVFSKFTREQGLSGSTAECGVYYGETAMFINKYWPDRTLHLFDTFEGFSDIDIIHDSGSFDAFKRGKFSDNPFKVESPEAIVEIVRNRMLYPKKIRIHKGYFPESARAIDDKFCFVNLDMDLYRPQLEGLRFFWNKMEKNGILLLHDYFHPELPGVKMAVEDFESELGISVPKIPIGDNCSIAVIKYS